MRRLPGRSDGGRVMQINQKMDPVAQVAEEIFDLAQMLAVVLAGPDATWCWAEYTAWCWRSGSVPIICARRAPTPDYY